MPKNDRLIKACQQQPVDRPPVWLMRQAGRYMSEYRAVRAQTPFLELCKTPKLAAEVTLQPYEHFGMDAVIIFSDILIPIEAMGMGLELSERGPVLHNPVRNAERLADIRVADPYQDTPFVLEVIQEVKKLIKDEVPVIGFAGAPWTMASYMVEGGTTKNFIELKRLRFAEPQLLHTLLEKITETVAKYLAAQLETGADLVQLFDTWAGELSRDDYRIFAKPYIQQIVKHIRTVSDRPIILYTNGCASILEDMIETGVDCVSVDWRIDLAEAKRRVAGRTAIQGNIDPCALLAPADELTKIVQSNIDKFGGDPGLIVNLGHGILPPTPPASVRVFVDAVKNYQKK
ncbi:MAG: uroporphyrinogen decarboxylase [Blastocatellia bacterium]|nr:uroporphyrinogen decarboxylase [Blastocatellia bacterium]MBN8724683.1 uroporphyrinogen decarboxylase [Acidobacteriota bacterium]